MNPEQARKIRHLIAVLNSMLEERPVFCDHGNGPKLSVNNNLDHAIAHAYSYVVGIRIPTAIAKCPVCSKEPDPKVAHYVVSGTKCADLVVV